MTTVTKTPSPLSVRDFRLLWIGESISLLGDQFTIIAFPWLVLQLTGNALILGTVMALMGIPRALFMLIGGAMVDRFTPRGVMLFTNFARLILVALLALLTLTGTIQVWMLFVLALAFGTADAFYFPGQSAVVPQVLEKDQLQMGNTIVQGTATLSQSIGPVIAGGLIALVGGTAAAAADALPSLSGIGVAFTIDALTFLLSVFTLWLMRPSRAAVSEQPSGGVIRAIRDGMAYMWKSESLRLIFVLVLATNFFVMGPIMVGIPVLSDRLPEGAAAYGVIMSAFGGGALVGIILSGVLPRLKPAHMGTILLAVQAIMGLAMALLPFAGSMIVAAVLSLIMGAVNGYVNISFFTWLQKRVPENFMGRVMSLIMFASVGLTPISTALSGALMDTNMTVLFVGAGIAMALVTLYAISSKSMRQMGLETIITEPISVVSAISATAEMPTLRATGEMSSVGD